jgi:hypothetical protein
MFSKLGNEDCLDRKKLFTYTLAAEIIDLLIKYIRHLGLEAYRIAPDLKQPSIGNGRCRNAEDNILPD